MEFPNLDQSRPTPPVKDTTPNPTNDLKREHESVDDFEHLEISPSKEKSNSFISDPLLNLDTDKEPLPSEVCFRPNFLDQSNNSNIFSQPEDSSKDFISGITEKSMFSSKTEPLDDFLKGSTFDNPSSSSSVGFEVSKFLEAETSEFKKPEASDSNFSKFSDDISNISGFKDGSKKDIPSDLDDFMHNEAIDDLSNQSFYNAKQSDQSIDEFPNMSPAKSVTPEPPAKSVTPKSPARSVTPESPAKSVTPEPPTKSVTPEPPANFDHIVKEEPKDDRFDLLSEKHNASQPKPEVSSIPITQSKPDSIVKDVPASNISINVFKELPPHSTQFQKEKENTPVIAPESHIIKKPSRNESDDNEIIQVDEVFRRIGLDSWFKPETLHPQVEALVYWRDPKKSGVVFGTILVALLSLTYYSFISVVAYFSLIILVGTISFKIYKSILQAVQKTSDGHPFKEILEMELTLPQEKVREVTDVGVAHLNAAILELRRLFLVEDLVDSIKFAVLLWLLTRVGAWFNGMTLIIIAFIALFSVPKIYENNKAQVDANLAIVQSKLQEITTKVKAALPIGKKEAEKDKEQ